MKNIKAMSIMTDGNSKRIAITYDVVDKSGKVTNPNNKTNRVVLDEGALSAINLLETYAQEIVDAE